MRCPLGLGHCIAFFEKFVEFGLLLIDAVGGQFLVGRSGKSGSLLDEFAKVVAEDGDALLDFGKGLGVGHSHFQSLEVARISGA
ncbi:protein of unknown function [Hyphomicrobium sp. MC1]|nr:protein of unknown function [Hyphomicrobium sp. MC1]